MPLIELWESNPNEFATYQVRQIVGISGGGRLKDNSDASDEFRKFLSLQESERLFEYADQCLTDKFEDGGFALQDVVNELGRRLDYEVENGLYRGSGGKIGFDGIWKAPEGHELIAEVKTSDAYRINLDTLADYRERLKAQSRISTTSSILIVVGRQDTGDLEAQIRGSRHAWDIRLISVEALTKLVSLKVAGDEETAKKIRSLLEPHEYTRLDELIDVLFLTVEDAKTPIETTPDDEQGELSNGRSSDVESGSETRSYQTDRRLLDQTRNRILDRLSAKLGQKFIKKSKAQYWYSENNFRICCTVSKFYERNNQYWYAYHPHWDKFLSEARKGILLLGCVGLEWAFAIPHEIISQNIDRLNQTIRNNQTMYWHIHLAQLDDGTFALRLSGKGNLLPVEQYKFPI